MPLESPLQNSLVSPFEVVSPVMFISGAGVIIYCDVRLQTRGRRQRDRYKLQVCSHPAAHGKLNCLDFMSHSQPRVSTPGRIEHIETLTALGLTWGAPPRRRPWASTSACWLWGSRRGSGGRCSYQSRDLSRHSRGWGTWAPGTARGQTAQTFWK